MATVIGNDYDHIDISNGTDTARHMLKDAAARDGIVSLSYDVLRNKIAASTSKTQTGNPIEIGDALPQTTDKVVIGLEPQQDLHGYDKPWVGGAGKNLIPSFTTGGTSNGLTWTVSDDGTIAINGTASATTTIVADYAPENGWKWDGTTQCWLSGCPTGGDASNKYALRIDGVNASSNYSGYDIGAGIRLQPINNTINITNQKLRFCIVIRSGFVCSNLVFKPMLNLGNSAEPYAPYSNICPISGYDSVTVTRTGKNLVFDKVENKNVGSAGALETLDGYSVYFAPVIEGDLYTITCDETSTVYGFWESYPPTGRTYNNSRTISSNKTFTAPITGYIGFRSLNNSTVAQIEAGDVATSYYAPQPMQQIQVSLSSVAGGTVYGGTVTINEDGTGTLVVDRYFVTFNGSEGWDQATSQTVQYIPKPSSPNVNSEMPIQCSMAEYVGAIQSANMVPGQIGWNGNRVNILLNLGKTSPSDLQAYLSENNIQCGFYLATPQTYLLTASQITTLLGYNRIYTNGDTLEVTYRTDKYATKDEAFAAFATDTASGAVASFTDGADDIPLKKLTAAIEPVQDLHGYDKPWPAGGNTNLLCKTPYPGHYNQSAGWDFTTDTSNVMQSYATSTGVVVECTVSWTGALYATAPLSAGTYVVHAFDASLSTTSGNFRATLYVLDSDYKVVSNEYNYQWPGNNAARTVTVTANQRIGLGITATAANTITLTGLAVTTQENENAPYVPYENICPISGWDEANVTRTGKNLFPSDISWTNGILDDNGNPISGASKYTDIIYGFKPDTSYTLQGSITNSNVSCRLYYRKLNGDWISRTGAINVIPYTFTTPANCGGIQLQISQSLNPTNIQIELGSTATSYEPYKGKTLSVNLKNATGSTVYGGTLTINSDGSGTVVVDMGFADLGTLDWTLVSGYFRTNGLNTLIKRVSSTTEVPNALCSNYPVSYWNDTSNNVLVIAASTVASGVPFVWISDPAYTDATTFKAAMSGVQFCYELATPITYTLTATQLRTLLGANNVWADCGNVSVVYRADPGELFDNVDDLNSYINSPLKRLFPEDVTSTQLDYASLWDGEHTFKLQLTIMRATTPSGARYGARMEWVPDV